MRRQAVTCAHTLSVHVLTFLHAQSILKLNTSLAALRAQRERTSQTASSLMQQRAVLERLRTDANSFQRQLAQEFTGIAYFSPITRVRELSALVDAHVC